MPVRPSRASDRAHPRTNVTKRLPQTLCTRTDLTLGRESSEHDMRTAQYAFLLVVQVILLCLMLSVGAHYVEVGRDRLASIVTPVTPGPGR